MTLFKELSSTLAHSARMTFNYTLFFLYCFSTPWPNLGYLLQNILEIYTLTSAVMLTTHLYYELALTNAAFSLSILLISTAAFDFFFFFFKCWSYTSIPAIYSALINSTSDLFHFWYFICCHWWPYQIQVACFSLRSLSPCSFLNNNSAVSHPVFLSYCASNRSLDNSIYWVEVGFLK